MGIGFKYHHIGIPVSRKLPGMKPVPHLRLWATDLEAGEFGVQWMYFEPECSLPALVRRVAHPAFEVEDLDAALEGRRILVAPNSPSPGIRVAMIEDCGAPVEFLEFEKPAG